MKMLAIIAGLSVSIAANAATAFFKYEIPTGGLTKQCVYEFAGSTYTRTVQSYQICPISIQV